MNSSTDFRHKSPTDFPAYPTPQSSCSSTPPILEEQGDEYDTWNISDNVQTFPYAKTELVQDASQESSDIVRISTEFHLNAEHIPDTMVVSSDRVFFYISSKRVMQACPTAFLPILHAPLSDERFRETTICLDISSDELNVILHALYKLPLASFCPEFATLVRAVYIMETIGIPPSTLVTPSTHLYELLMDHAPLHPLDVYALAAHCELRPLAVAVSSHLLSLDLSTITDPMAERIGATYLKKLLLLHSKRFSALKDILITPPQSHLPTMKCSFEQQTKLTRAWALVAAYLCWDARPDLSAHSIDNALSPLLEHLECDQCHEILRLRINDVLAQWTSVKRTI